MKNFMKQNKAITLITLVITIIVILILARSYDCDINRRFWIITKSTNCKKYFFRSRRIGKNTACSNGKS